MPRRRKKGRPAPGYSPPLWCDAGEFPFAALLRKPEPAPSFSPPLCSGDAGDFPFSSLLPEWLRQRWEDASERRLQQQWTPRPELGWCEWCPEPRHREADCAHTGPDFCCCCVFPEEEDEFCASLPALKSDSAPPLPRNSSAAESESWRGENGPDKSEADQAPALPRAATPPATALPRAATPPATALPRAAAARGWGTEAGRWAAISTGLSLEGRAQANELHPPLSSPCLSSFAPVTRSRLTFDPGGWKLRGRDCGVRRRGRCGTTPRQSAKPCLSQLARMRAD